MEKCYGFTYKVFIEFNKNLINTEEKIKKFLKKELLNVTFDTDSFDEKVYDDEIKVISLEGNKLELLWGIDINEGSHEIEEVLY